MADMTHPAQVGGKHYTLAYDVWSLAMDTRMPFSQANVLKYYTRAPAKNGVEDAEKAICYLDGLYRHAEEASDQPAPTYGEEYIQWCHACTSRFLDQLNLAPAVRAALTMVATWHLLEGVPEARVRMYSAARTEGEKLLQELKGRA